MKFVFFKINFDFSFNAKPQLLMGCLWSWVISPWFYELCLQYTSLIFFQLLEFVVGKNMLPLLPGLCCGSYMENSWSHRSSILACLIVKPSLWLFPGSKSRCQLQFFFPSRSNLSQHKTYVWFLKLGGISSYYSKFKTYSKRPSLGVLPVHVIIWTVSPHQSWFCPNRKKGPVITLIKSHKT